MSLSNPLLSCGVCHKPLFYKDLIIERDYADRWDNYLTPCCHSEQWMLASEANRADKYLHKITHDVR